MESEQYWYLIMPLIAGYNYGTPKYKFIEVGPIENFILRDAYLGDSHAMDYITSMRDYPRHFNLDWSKIKVNPAKDVPRFNIYRSANGYRLNDIFKNQDYFNENAYRVVSNEVNPKEYEREYPGILKMSGIYDRRGGKSKKKKYYKKGKPGKTRKHYKRTRSHKSKR